MEKILQRPFGLVLRKDSHHQPATPKLCASRNYLHGCYSNSLPVSGIQGSQMWPQRVLINSGPSSGIKEFSNPDLLRTLRGSLPGPILLKVKVLSTYFELRCAALALLAPFYTKTDINCARINTEVNRSP